MKAIPLDSVTGAAGQTVCSMTKPFKIGVHSDGLEYADAAGADPEGTLDNNRGFSISMSFIKLTLFLISESSY